eukprot:396935_1
MHSFPVTILVAVILSTLFAVLGMLTSLYIVCALSKAEDVSNKSNEYETMFKKSTIIAVITFMFCNIFVAVYCIWVYIAYDDDLKNDYQTLFNGYPIHLTQSSCYNVGKFVVLFICNARLYYTFNKIPGL